MQGKQEQKLQAQCRVEGERLHTGLQLHLWHQDELPCTWHTGPRLAILASIRERGKWLWWSGLAWLSALDKASGTELLLSTLGFGDLTFFLDCMLLVLVFCFVSFSFVFPGEGRKKQEARLQSSAAAHLTVFTFANVNQVWFYCIISMTVVSFLFFFSASVCRKLLSTMVYAQNFALISLSSNTNNF